VLVAPARAREDWLEQSGGLAVLPDPMTRSALARAWLRDAQMQHASIAAFARLSLQLLALGAPPELVGAVHTAAQDEIELARACFALASRYAGHALGPGELPMPSSLTLSTLGEAAAASVHEGCVAQTIASHMAYEQLQHASDEAAQAALIRIATGQMQHAALAYQFVRWAIATGGAEVKAAVRAAFAAAYEQLLAAESEVQDDFVLEPWHAHGRLSVSEQRACVLACLRDVIEPCAQALLLRHGEPCLTSHALTSAV
jgi:hypothetical protein